MLIEKEQQSFSTCTGRIAGVAGALLGGALVAYSDGELNVGTIAGTALGGVVGYALGDMTDNLSKMTGKQSGVLIALTAASGFSTAAGSAMSLGTLKINKTNHQEILDSF